MHYQEDNGPPMFTYAAIAAFIAFFGAEYKQFDLSKFYAYPWRVADGELWRLITCTFLHGGLLHILFNAVMFVRFSSVIDNWLGPWVAMLLYVFFAMSSSAAQLLVSKGIGGIGASGVVYGLFGFLWIMSRRRDDAAEAANPYTVQTMFGWLFVCTVVNMFGGNIGNTAHVVGLILGVLVGKAFVARKRQRIAVAILTLVIWAIPMVFIQPVVWKHTLAYVYPLNQYYRLRSISPELREQLEGPESAPEIGLFPRQRR